MTASAAPTAAFAVAATAASGVAVVAVAPVVAAAHVTDTTGTALATPDNFILPWESSRCSLLAFLNKEIIIFLKVDTRTVPDPGSRSGSSLEPDLDPSKVLDPDSSKMLNPDPHVINADPQHWFKG
jgi:hypothetical protein